MAVAPTNSKVDSDLRRMPTIGFGFASYSMLQTDSSCCGEEFWDANKIVGGGGKHEEPLDQAAPAMSGLAQTDRRQHAETFNDFYKWIINYDLTSQWISRDGSFSYCYEWLSISHPSEVVKSWAASTIEHAFGVHPESFEIL